MTGTGIDMVRFRESINKSAEIIASLSSQIDSIAKISDEIIGSLKAGCKVLTAGNGGSAAEALHMAEELVGRFKSNRVSLPAVALVADSTVLTCIGNDFGFDRIFSRQVEGLGKPGDVLVLFSTTGNAPNLRLALESARSREVKTICMLGNNGGPLAGQGDQEIIIDGTETARIQEAHQVLVHLMLEAVEEAFAVEHKAKK